MNQADFPVLHDVSFQFGARPILDRITLADPIELEPLFEKEEAAA